MCTFAPVASTRHDLAPAPNQIGGARTCIDVHASAGRCMRVHRSARTSTAVAGTTGARREGYCCVYSAVQHCCNLPGRL